MLDEKLRKLGIGGSEVGAVLGEHPRLTAWEVWWSKKGGGEREATEEMLLGKDMEPVILRYYERRTGHAARQLNETFRNERRPWQVGTPDAECTDVRRLIELKFVSPYQWFHWGEPPDGVPVWIFLQIQWYLDALGYDVGDVVALSGSKLMIYPVERNADLGRAMNEQIADWWTKYIAGSEEPPIEPSDAARSWLRAKYPRAQADIRLATQAEIEMLTEYAQVRAEVKQKEKEQETLEVQIQQAIGPAEGLEWEHGKFTWKKPKSSQITDWETLAQDVMADFAEDERKATIARFTTTRENSRRIHFKTDLEAVEAAA